jgi:RNA-binding motif protein, X-linked 2
MNVIREIEKLNEKELQRGTMRGSWHEEYKDSAWVFVGGLPFELTEGDVLCFMSQWGDVSSSQPSCCPGCTPMGA